MNAHTCIHIRDFLLDTNMDNSDFQISIYTFLILGWVDGLLAAGLERDAWKAAVVGCR
jgi:hypothetical protein